MITPEKLAKSGTEHGHQAALFCWAAMACPQVWRRMFAIPNGGARADDRETAKIRGGNLKAEGVKRGVPDVFLAWPYGRAAGLFIEMKRPADKERDRRAGTLGEDQDMWHEVLREMKYVVEVCYSWTEARDAIKRYFGEV